jgi:hypothetical protein
MLRFLTKNFANGQFDGFADCTVFSYCKMLRWSMSYNDTAFCIRGAVIETAPVLLLVASPSTTEASNLTSVLGCGVGVSFGVTHWTLVSPGEWRRVATARRDANPKS